MPRSCCSRCMAGTFMQNRRAGARRPVTVVCRERTNTTGHSQPTGHSRVDAIPLMFTLSKGGIALELLERGIHAV